MQVWRSGHQSSRWVKFVAYVGCVMGLFGLDAEVATEECCCELCQGGRVKLGCV